MHSKMLVTTTLSIPIQIKTNANARDAYTESLKMILQHVADFHITIVDIISEKYNIPVDEIMNTITSDSRYTNMMVDPKIHHFSSSNPNQTQPSIQTQIYSEKPETTVTTTREPVIKKTSEKKIKIKPKTAVALATTTLSS